nr:hypothetical protein [uncultured Aquabacterium sp.]
MSRINRLAAACVLASAAIAPAAHAQLYPGSKPMGWGNISAGQTFYQSLIFDVWGAPSPPTSEIRFVDLVANAGSVISSSSGNQVFMTGVWLTSADNSVSYGGAFADSGAGSLTATYSNLAEGRYRVHFEGFSNPPTPEPLATVYEWGYIVTASVASPAPEASDLAMLAMGLAGVAAWSRRRARRAAA